MINKLAVYYKAEGDGLQAVEGALIALAPPLHARIASAPNPHVRVATLIDGASAQTPHVTAQGYTPTALRACWPASPKISPSSSDAPLTTPG